MRTMISRFVSFSLYIKRPKSIESKMPQMLSTGKKTALSSAPAKYVFKRLQVAKASPTKAHAPMFLPFILFSPFFKKAKKSKETAKQKRKAIRIKELVCG